MTNRWTRPYYGVQHMMDIPFSAGQITINDYGTFVNVYVLIPNQHTRNRFPAAEAHFDTVDEAKAWADQQRQRFFN